MDPNSIDTSWAPSVNASLLISSLYSCQLRLEANRYRQSSILLVVTSFMSSWQLVTLDTNVRLYAWVTALALDEQRATEFIVFRSLDSRNKFHGWAFMNHVRDQTFLRLSGGVRTSCQWTSVNFAHMQTCTHAASARGADGRITDQLVAYESWNCLNSSGSWSRLAALST